MAQDRFQRIEIDCITALRQWLVDNHRSSPSIWLVTWKKQHPDKHVPYTDVVDEALCFGWIDSVPRKLDADRSMLRLSPRNPKSAWSKVNKQKVERLTATGRMAPAGFAAVAAAKANGAWDFLNDVDALIKPPDLVTALALEAEAGANFDRFAPSAQRGILEWIKQAKTAQTRAKRVAETAAMAAVNLKASFPVDKSKFAKLKGRWSS